MRCILIYFLIVINADAFAQLATRLTGKNYDIAIFSAEQAEHYLIGSTIKFTPNEEDVLYVDSLLRAQVKEINKPAYNQGIGKCPYIHKKFKHYRRQYVGFINETGERILFINAFYDKKRRDTTWLKSVSQTLDGCSFYWSIEYNIDSGSFQKFIINGIA